jgi:hypothetical protein
MTKFNKSKNADMSILPEDYDNIATLHISKGRELDYHVPNKAINYKREKNSPKFRELKDMDKKEIIPSWLERADMGDD